MSKQIDRQLSLPKLNGHGGARPGAGRKPSGRRVGVPHRTRAAHQARHPLHVTLRAREGLPSLRSDRLLFEAVRGAIASGQRPAFRIVQFSVQSNHLHLIVEAHDKRALARGMQGLTLRMVHAVHRALGTAGAVFGDRYHAHVLKTPRETRSALLYVLQNWAKHGRGGATTRARRRPGSTAGPGRHRSATSPRSSPRHTLGSVRWVGDAMDSCD